MTLYDVTFSAHVASGSVWTVRLGGATQTTAGNAIIFSEPNGTYSYRISGPPGYNASVPAGNVTVAGKAVSVSVTWITHLFPVQFTETGLPRGTSWHVFLNYSNKLANQSLPIVFHSPNGSFPYSVGADVPWVPTPLNGVVNVHGAGVNVTISFAPPAARYTVTMAEQGLPSGTVWTYSLAGVVHSALAPTPVTQAFSNGSYPYTVSPTGSFLPHPGSGTVVVAGTDVTLTVQFTPPANYSVRFSEQGLTGGTWWVAITLPAENLSAPAGSSISFNLTNGTYGYTTGTTAHGWTASPRGGAFLVAGLNLTVPPVAFVGGGSLWNVEFVPSGIGSASWWVAIGDSIWNGSGISPIQVGLYNGTYTWTAGGSAGLFPHAPGGTLTVAGGTVVVDISFSPGATAAKPSGLAATYGTEILVVGIILGAAIVVIALSWRRRGRPRSPTDPTPPPGSTGGPRAPP